MPDDMRLPCHQAPGPHPSRPQSMLSAPDSMVFDIGTPTICHFGRCHCITTADWHGSDSGALQGGIRPAYRAARPFA